MAKEALKEHVAEVKGRVCAITQAPLPEITRLFDTHRGLPKRKNGEYTMENTDIVDPVAHMKEHYVHRERTPDMELLKSICDDRTQLIKLKNKMNSQLLAYKRKTDFMNEEIKAFIETTIDPITAKINEYDKILIKQLMSIESEYDLKLRDAAMSVRGVGKITVAYCLIYIDIAGYYPEDHKKFPGKEKCRHASSVWKYVGFDKPCHSRYEKGVSGGGNKTMRRVLYCMADSQVKSKGAYREIYDFVKARLSVSEKLTKTYNTAGNLVTLPWNEAKPSHRHGAALRAVMKHFLADYWFVGRTIYGLSTSPVYAEAQLGKEGHRTISPVERGWVF